ncbi:sulfite exporter TauE/SafE family protein [Flavobacterium zepuense]|uniref:Probable membrane transporter protein n=1 Tax=Flavobacterium zepuense TaxID=2593302 RepID=A0A552V1C6_9FLAO|nr:sulfite exporter TauE/SafE family protein [Flavobacterium zepuense]TRW24276.1 sulfite exporter TauE/SafE family protein [Flavobacterium zepuense]
MIITLIALFLGAVVAFWISAICGGGASLIIIPVLNILLPVPVVPFALTIGTFTSSVSRIGVFRKHIYLPVFFWFVPFSLPAVWLGAYMLKYINSVYLQLAIAMFLIYNISGLFSKNGKASHTKRRSKYKTALIGFCAGFISGLTGAVGLLFNKFYLKMGLTKEQIIATRAANEVFLHLIKMALYIAMGIYSGKAFMLGLVVALASVISASTIKYILPLLSEKMFAKIAYSTMVLSGAFLLVSASLSIITANQLNLTANYSEEKYETTISWTNGHYVLEYKPNGRLEFERSVTYNDLPQHIKKHYDSLALVYEDIKLEKVYTPHKPAGYELYAFKDNRMFKFKTN